MLNTDIRKSPAVIRGIETERKGSITYVSFVVILGEADGAYLIFAEKEFLRLLKKEKRQIKNIKELNGEKCFVNIINHRKIEFAHL